MKKTILLSYILLLSGLACKKADKTVQETKSLTFSKIVILGNSILFSPANPPYGWNGSWGMAASAAEKDFAHLLTRQFQDKNPSSVVSIKNIAQFEREFTTYDLDANLKDLKDSKPDLLILRIGENVATDFDVTAFDHNYVALINYFKAGNPNLKVLAAGSFWQGKDAVDAVMKKYSPFISLSSLGQDMSNYAWGLFQDQGIASHPNDKGMQGIDNLMWDAITKLK